MSRLRIRTAELPPGLRPKGQDVLVEMVRDDGTVESVPWVISARINIDSRRDYVEATLVVHVDADIEIDPRDVIVKGRDEARDGFVGDKTKRPPPTPALPSDG